MATGRVIGVFNTLDAVPLLPPSLMGGRLLMLLLLLLWLCWWWKLPRSSLLLLPVDEPKVLHALVVGEEDMLVEPRCPSSWFLLTLNPLALPRPPPLLTLVLLLLLPLLFPLAGLNGVRLYIGWVGGSGIDEAKGCREEEVAE
jgi:hypothetical protein